VRFEGLIRDAHQSGLRVLITELERTGVKVRTKEMLAMLSLPDFRSW